MAINTRQFLLAASAGVAFLGLAVAAAPAQNFPTPANPPVFRVAPDPRVQQAAANIALLGQAYANVPAAYGAPPQANVFYSPFAGGLGAAANLYSTPGLVGAASLSSSPYSNQSTSSSGYSPYSPYPPYVQDPASGFLTGAADVIGSQSRFMLGREQAKLIRQAAEQAKIDTRRRLFDEWQYEKASTPSAQQAREQVQADELRRSQTNPAQTEVWSGKALNDLLDHAARLQAKGMGPSIPLEDDVLKHLNVTSGKGGNIGLLRNEGQLTWPAAVKGTAFDGDRKQVEQGARDAFKQAQFGKVDPGTLQDLNGAVKKLNDQVAKQIFDLSPSQYIEATRYLKQLDEAVKALGQPDVADYFTPKLGAQGKNVAELVKHMASKGLRFAPAVTGDEPYYNALYNRLVQYDLALQNSATAEKQP